MRVLFGINHPGHVHFFKNIIWKLQEHGHEIKIVARDKECTIDLLKAYGLEFESLGEHYTGAIGKALGMLKLDYTIYRIASKFKPDIFVSNGSPYTAQVSWLMRKPCITFEDTENTTEQYVLYAPFTTVVCTPSCFTKQLDPDKHIRYNGYTQLAYLNPAYFKPDPTVLDDLGVSEKDRFVVLRFVSWGATHDRLLKGFSDKDKLDAVKAIEKHAKVFITSEKKLSKELEPYRFSAPPHKIHSLLYYAQLYFGEGGTMATEAAVLGTPCVHVETATFGDKVPSAANIFCGNFIELSDKYGLVCMFNDHKKALQKALALLEDRNSKRIWQKKRKTLLADKIDVTKFVVDLIENHPQSFADLLGKQRSK